MTAKTDDLPEAEPYSLPKTGSVIARVAIITIIAGFAAMWIYIFGFARADNPDFFTDREWPVKASALCVATRERIAALPSAATFKDIEPKSEALRQRAEVADKVTAEYRTLIAALKAIPAADEKTSKGLSFWFADWDVYMSDRDNRTAEWRNGEDGPFLETANERGQPMSYRIDPFAKLNKMPSCTIPNDVG